MCNTEHVHQHFGARVLLHSQQSEAVQVWEEQRHKGVQILSSEVREKRGHDTFAIALRAARL
jgi:hypothetical protein